MEFIGSEEKSGFRHSFILGLNGHLASLCPWALPSTIIEFILSLTPLVVPRGLPEAPKASCFPIHAEQETEDAFVLSMLPSFTFIGSA